MFLAQLFNMKTPKVVDGRIVCQNCRNSTTAQMRLTKREENNKYDVRMDNLPWYNSGELRCPNCEYVEKNEPPINIEELKNFKFNLGLKDKIKLILIRLK